MFFCIIHLLVFIQLPRKRFFFIYFLFKNTLVKTIEGIIICFHTLLLWTVEKYGSLKHV